MFTFYITHLNTSYILRDNSVVVALYKYSDDDDDDGDTLYVNE